MMYLEELTNIFMAWWLVCRDSIANYIHSLAFVICNSLPTNSSESCLNVSRTFNITDLPHNLPPNPLLHLPSIAIWFSYVASCLVVFVFIKVVLCCCCSGRKGDGSGNISNVWRRRTSACTAEGWRWLKQARYDLEAVKNDLNAICPAYEWACFKCHQATEKAIKSVLYSLDLVDFGDLSRSHDIVDLAMGTKCSLIVDWAVELQGLLGFVGRMRYPDRIKAPLVPHDVFREEDAIRALDIADALVTYVNRYYFV